MLDLKHTKFIKLCVEQVSVCEMHIQKVRNVKYWTIIPSISILEENPNDFMERHDQ